MRICAGTLSVNVVDERLDPGTQPNEDLVWVGERSAIVLDGATGLTDTQYTEAESDGLWYVESLLDELQGRIQSPESLGHVVTESIEGVAKRFEAYPENADVGPDQRPSAAGAILRSNGDVVEYFVLGDCSVIFETNEAVMPVIGEGPRELDSRVRQRMNQLRGDASRPIPYPELRELVDDMLIRHREQMNKPGGYWTLSMTLEATEHAHTGELSLNELRRFVAFTDGFEGLVHRYDVFANWGSLLRYLSQNGLNRAINTLRAYENSDPECRQYPRIKPSDDVGVIYGESEY